MTNEGPGRSDLVEYQQCARDWAAVVGTDAKRANALFDRLHTLAMEIRRSADGRAGLEGLLSEEETGVRLLVATEWLAWDAPRARSVLAAIEHAGKSHSLSAKHTLPAYEAGTLDLDW